MYLLDKIERRFNVAGKCNRRIRIENLNFKCVKLSVYRARMVLKLELRAEKCITNQKSNVFDGASNNKGNCRSPEIASFSVASPPACCAGDGLSVCHFPAESANYVRLSGLN
jgi:hypothetical protein